VRAGRAARGMAKACVARRTVRTQRPAPILRHRHRPHQPLVDYCEGGSGRTAATPGAHTVAARWRRMRACYALALVLVRLRRVPCVWPPYDPVIFGHAHDYGADAVTSVWCVAQWEWLKRTTQQLYAQTE
jgi:hypothetical protein